VLRKERRLPIESRGIAQEILNALKLARPNATAPIKDVLVID
jgi:hypothetical protein